MTTDPRLDRIPQRDPRTLNYPVRALFGARTSDQVPLRGYTWPVGIHLDQGREGACVGYGFAHELAAKPGIVRDVTSDVARSIYHAAQREDPWDGGSYAGAFPFYEGTSVLAGAQVLKRAGYFTEYRWAFSEREMAIAVGYRGPVVIGVNWYTGMFTPNRDGFLEVTGQLEGGHCILVHGFSATRGLYKVWNSWGADWGMSGTAFISRGDMARLIVENGEVCLPVRSRLREARDVDANEIPLGDAA